LFVEGDLPLATDGLLDFGEFFAGVAAIGEADPDLGDLLAGDAVLGDLFPGDADLGDLFPGDAALGDLFPGDAALGEGDLDLGNLLPVGVLGEALLALGVFLGDGVFLFAGLCSYEKIKDTFKKRS